MKSSEHMKLFMQAMLAMVGMLFSTDGIGQVKVTIDGLSGNVEQATPAQLHPGESLEIKVIRADFVHYDYSIELDKGVVIQPSYPITGLEVGQPQALDGKSYGSADEVIRFSDLKAVTAADLDRLVDDYNRLPVDSTFNETVDAQAALDKIDTDLWKVSPTGNTWPDHFANANQHWKNLNTWKKTMRSMLKIKSSIDNMKTRIQNKEVDNSLKSEDADRFLNNFSLRVNADLVLLNKQVSMIEERASRIRQIMKNHPKPELIFMHYAQVENKRYTVRVFRKTLAPPLETDFKTQLPPDSGNQESAAANKAARTTETVNADSSTSSTGATTPAGTATGATTPAGTATGASTPVPQTDATAPAAPKQESPATQDKGELIATYTFEVHALSRLNVGIGIPLIKMPGHRQFGIVEQVGEGDVKEFVVRETSNDDLEFNPALQVGVYLGGPVDDLALTRKSKFMLTVGSELDAKPKQFFAGLAWDSSSGYAIGMGITHFRQTELQEGYSVGQIIPSVLDENGEVTGALITELPTHQSDKLGYYLGISFRPKIFSALKDLIAKFKE